VLRCTWEICYDLYDDLTEELTVEGLSDQIGRACHRI
jgi:hypothetical protein